ncbi:Preprotein translocase subunit Tim44 [Sphingomonas antarctica]|uniref:Tim44/TimA family putative adaptor protein n=1 Tax=Sphingomonas antarctica TaxID=2040274 RepID=UPI0039E92CC1
MVGIVLLAMVAAFLAMRLYAVLGKRTGHEQTFVAPPAEPLARPATQMIEGQPAASTIVADSPVEASAAAGLRAIAAADGGFDAPRFVEGATAAYRMILEAYWRGDVDTLKPLTGEHVFDAFSHAIEERKAAGFALDNRLVTIDKAIISAAMLEGRQAEITVRFDADIAAVTRDTNGKVVAGSLDDAVPTHDAWTFAREVRAGDPNWLLIDTDESA